MCMGLNSVVSHLVCCGGWAAAPLHPPSLLSVPGQLNITLIIIIITIIIIIININILRHLSITAITFVVPAKTSYYVVLFLFLLLLLLLLDLAASCCVALFIMDKVIFNKWLKHNLPRSIVKYWCNVSVKSISINARSASKDTERTLRVSQGETVF
ncbi:hypothetical protein E2C01_009778 [Portunus trituberculatus]|uniref:Uncharacterized protein n=1 Tax=Portunus trituberculatus TaxID=210409 RepID=A0A5B7D6X4_PORTR|nr:hypothetical protein [Portunus trituberculatus]